MAVRQYVYRVEKTPEPFFSDSLNSFDENGWELVSCNLNYEVFSNYSTNVRLDEYSGGKIPVPNGYVYTFRRRFDHTKD